MLKCPHCHAETLVKAGFNRSGSQRYRCKACHRYATLAPKQNGYPQIIGGSLSSSELFINSSKDLTYKFCGRDVHQSVNLAVLRYDSSKRYLEKTFKLSDVRVDWNGYGCTTVQDLDGPNAVLPNR